MSVLEKKAQDLNPSEPCEGIEKALTTIEIAEAKYMNRIPEWELAKRKEEGIYLIRRTYDFKNPDEANDFATKVEAINREGSYSLTVLRSNDRCKIKLSLYNPTLNGLTKDNFTIAEKINELEKITYK